MARPVARSSRAAALPEWIAPQLTQLVDAAPDCDQWLHEIKFDGYRMHARLDRGTGPISIRLSDQPAVRIVIGEQQGAEIGRLPSGSYRFGEMGDRAIALSDATHQEELL